MKVGEDVVAIPYRLLINHENILKTAPFSNIAKDLESTFYRMIKTNSC